MHSNMFDGLFTATIAVGVIVGLIIGLAVPWLWDLIRPWLHAITAG